MSEDSHNPPPVTIVYTCELNSNRPLKVWCANWGDQHPMSDWISPS